MASASTDSLAASGAAPPRERPPELEDRLNHYLYHPLAARLARALRPTAISPNVVSVAGMLLVWGTAWCYSRMAAPAGVATGFALHLLWHVLDGADGDLARLRGTQSPTGELVDGVCDYAGHTLLYFVLAAVLHGQIGLWAWPLVAAAGASHIAQTNHAETQRRSYLWRAYGVPWLKHAQAAGDAVFQGRTLFSLLFGWMARDYLKLAGAMTPQSARLDAMVDEAAGDVRRLERIRRLTLRGSARILTLQKLLGPNPRTILLGASMAFGSPLYYFLAELVALNLALFASVRLHERLARAIAEGAGRARHG